ncbi:MAG: response regulator, partial [Chromatiales bacterium]|nr:response regulator [Chromatiales bacterium]
LNLVGNAIKFTEQGSVKLALINERDTLGERLEFVIEDTGIGIDPQAQRKIFDVFTQADGSMSRRHGGSGLGLAISRQLTELMGGELSLESEPGIGSTFRVRLHLPFAEAPESLNHADQPTETPRLSPKAAGTSPRVLLVEDNPVNQTVAVAMLEEIGVLVEVANNGAEALSAIENSAFDLVFMDCQMPEMDGFEATQRIRALSDPDKRQIPVVAMTANALKGDREYCLSVGMSDYLTKPFSLEQLYEMVARWLPVDPSTPSQSTAEHSPDAAVSRH